MYRVRIWLEDGRIETQFCQDERYADMKQSRAERTGRKCEVMDCAQFKELMVKQMNETVHRVATGMTTQDDADIVTHLFHRLNGEMPDEMKFIEFEGD
tara:strand:+ start:1261 stop:1554 length:294 start_codon:yes stop_codon:yes gene_type:complete